MSAGLTSRSSATGSGSVLPPTRALVVGIGNTLRADDGLGPIFLQWFRARYATPASIQLLDGGTGGGGLLEWLEVGDDLLLVDALAASRGGQGGILRVLEREELEAGRKGLSRAAHELDLGTLLASASWFGIELRSVQLVGLTASSTELSPRLSDPVARALPDLAEALLSRLETLGFPPPRPR